MMDQKIELTATNHWKVVDLIGQFLKGRKFKVTIKSIQGELEEFASLRKLGDEIPVDVLDRDQPANMIRGVVIRTTVRDFHFRSWPDKLAELEFKGDTLTIRHYTQSEVEGTFTEVTLTFKRLS